MDFVRVKFDWNRLVTDRVVPPAMSAQREEESRFTAQRVVRLCLTESAIELFFTRG